MAGGLDLHPGEGPGHLLDHLKGDRPADLLAEVVQHPPAPFRVDSQRGRHVCCERPGQLAQHHGLVDEQGRGRVRLEPDVAGGRRGPQDARQLPDPDLLHRSGDGPADGRHGVLQPALGPGEPAAGRPGPPGQAGAPVLQLLDHPGGGRVGAGQLVPAGPGQALGKGGQGPGDGQQGRPLGPGRGVLVLLEAAQQDGVGAEQVAQAGQELARVARPDQAGALDLGQALGPVTAGQQHLGLGGMGHHPADVVRQSPLMAAI